LTIQTIFMSGGVAPYGHTARMMTLNNLNAARRERFVLLDLARLHAIAVG
jgi:hypothetical protein